MKIIAFLSAVLCTALLSSCGKNVTEVNTKIYYVDSTLNRLLPYEETIYGDTVEEQAQSALDKLVDVDENNNKIRSIIPNTPGVLTVTLDNDIACVNVSGDVRDTIPKSRDFEKLFIYQITDTLTEIKGIRFVRFKIDGESEKNLMGFYDMREVYKYMYPE